MALHYAQGLFRILVSEAILTVCYERRTRDVDDLTRLFQLPVSAGHVPGESGHAGGEPETGITGF